MTPGSLHSTRTTHRRPRGLLVTTLIAVVFALIAAGCGDAGEGDSDEVGADGPTGTGTANGAGAGEFAWDQFSGSSIRVIAYDNAWGEAIQEMLPEFTELTGIEVNLELLQFSQARDRVNVELQAGNSDLDAFIGPPQQQGRTFAENNWYVDLSSLAEDASITSPEYRLDDFRDNLMEDQTIDGTLVGIPTEVLVSMMFYRSDLLEEAGVEVPETFDELREVLEAVDDPNGVRGWSARGSAMSTVFSPFLYHMGASWVSDDGEPGFTTDEGLEAFELYTDLISQYGPPGALDRGPRETLSLMAAGDLAMTTDVSTLWSLVADPEQSTVAEDVAFAPLPGGPGGDSQAYTTEALSISALSDNPEPAWLFVQWATGTEAVETLQVEHGIAGGRESITDFGDQPQSWVDAYLEGIDGARPMTPDIPDAAEVREAVETSIQQILANEQDVETAVEGAAEEFRRITEN